MRKLIRSIASHAQRFKELVGSDAEPETMEEKITLALGYVKVPLSPQVYCHTDGQTTGEGYHRSRNVISSC
jgi:hypothetical protein